MCCKGILPTSKWQSLHKASHFTFAPCVLSQPSTPVSGFEFSLEEPSFDHCPGQLRPSFWLCWHLSVRRRRQHSLIWRRLPMGLVSSEFFVTSRVTYRRIQSNISSLEQPTCKLFRRLRYSTQCADERTIVSFQRPQYLNAQSVRKQSLDETSKKKAKKRIASRSDTNATKKCW